MVHPLLPIRRAGPQRGSAMADVLDQGGDLPCHRGEPLDHLQGQGAWLDTIEKRFREMHQQLVREGWRPTGHGAHCGPASTDARPSIGTRCPTKHRTPRDFCDDPLKMSIGPTEFQPAHTARMFLGNHRLYRY